MFWIQEGNKNQAAGSEGSRRWCARRELGLTRSRTHSKDKTKAMARAGSPLPCQLCKPRVEMANQNSNIYTLGKDLRGYI